MQAVSPETLSQEYEFKRLKSNRRGKKRKSKGGPADLPTIPQLLDSQMPGMTNTQRHP